MKQLPPSWGNPTLLECSQFVRGVTYTKSDAVDQTASGLLPIIRANNIQARRFELNDLVYVPANLVSAEQVLKAGDVVIAISSGSISVVGKAAQVRKEHPMSFGAFCGVLRPSPVIHARYFGHFFSSKAYRDAVSDLARGVNINNLKRDHFQAIRIPLAPLAEQERIADKLDTVRASVDTVNTRLARVAPLLKRFRQSVLAAATSGRLTEDWRTELHANLGNAEALTSALAHDHAAFGGHERGNASEPTKEAHDLSMDQLPDGWRISTLRECCTPGRPICYGILMPGPELEDGVPYIRVADFPGNRLNLSGIKKTSPEIDLQFKRARLKTGDLLLSIRGSVGRLIEIPDSLSGANITQDTARLAISNHLNSKYIYYGLLSPDTQRRMANAVRGVAVRGINIGDVRALQLPIPTVEEQNEIVRRIETLFAFADRLEACLQAAQIAADRLTPSLLAKAFRGELVPQDPNDEPASELLKRLAASAPASASKRGRAKSSTAA